MRDLEEHLRDQVRTAMRRGYTFAGLCNTLQIRPERLRVLIRESFA